ncbi:MAG: response regulator [Deltaproteobacteria bacterium]|nr:response regulator [Deltaproteobacteria bacterium]
MKWMHRFQLVVTGQETLSGETPHQAKERHRIFQGIITIGIGGAILMALGAVAYLQGNLILAVIDYLIVVFLAILIVYGLKTHRYLPAAVSGIAVMGLLDFYLFFTGGVNHTGHLWLYPYALFSCFLLGSKRGAIATFLLFVPAMLLMFLPNDMLPGGFIGYDRDFIIRFIPSFLLVFAYSFIYERLEEKQIDQLCQKNTLLERTVDQLRENEAALKAVQADLENRVMRRTEDLSTANAELQREIETRGQMQEVLQRANTLFATVLDGIDADIFVVDKEGATLLFMNQHMRQKSGNHRTGNNLEQWAISGIPLNHVFDAPETGMNSVTDDPNVRQVQNPEDGKWYLYQSTEVQWVDGRMAIVHVATDISMLKQAEASNRELQTQLHQARKMEAIGLLAGGVAHDLNNILSGIVSYPELLLKDLEETSAMRKPLSIIKKSGEKAAAVVNDLLTIARSGIASMDIVNLNDIIHEYVNSPEHKNLLNHHHIQVEVQPESLLANISGSVVHLSKVLMNLVVNAAEAMPTGGLVRIRTENLVIDDHTKGCDGKKTGEYVLLTVADSGLGMSTEDQERIFEPFFTRKAMGRSGTGLGMTVVWRSVADHQGFIDIESTIGVGTTFGLYFPAVRDKQTEKLPALSMDQYLSRGETILIVDDMKDQRIIASAMLNRLGYRVVTASSGEQAIDYLKSNSVDLVILDMIMGEGMNGRQTYERILAMRPGQKAVIASGFAESEEVRKAREIGASRFIKKPYTLETIGVALKNALAKGAAG